MPIPQLHQVRQYGRLPEGERKQKKIKIIKLAALIIGVLFVLGVIGGTVTVAWINKDLPDPNRLSNRQISQSTKIYDRAGEHLLYEIYQNQKRTLVELDQIPNYAKKATIAIEDKYFYEHKGIRLTSILRAAFNDLIGRKSGSGGASTLTQQLVKNAIVGNEKSLFRKIKEAILALRIEKKYSKDEILKMYLNEIPYGSTNYGIEAASQSYFGKNAKDLSLAESAALAAIPKAPSYYLNNFQALKKRRDYILSLMEEQGYITADQANEAASGTLKISKSAGPMEAPHFVLYVKQLLADRFGEKIVDEGGLKVITTLDYDKQKIADSAIKEIGDKNLKESNANNAAMVAIDPKTGQILAMVGSRDYKNDDIDGQFNVAVLGRRQPGSSFKPFVYTAAFEKGYTPDTVLYDVTTNFGTYNGKDYIPKNYNGKEHGLLTMRKALQGSLNIPAVKTLYLVGLQNALGFAERFGYTTFANTDPGLSLVLGGAEVTLLEHTNAYATLADEGVYHPPVSILQVTDYKGEKLYEWKPVLGTEAVKPELAYTISDILSDDESRSFIFGSRGNLTLPDRVVAAKTGTTNDNKDAWTMGYTPSLAAGVWVGNTLPSPMKSGGNTLAATIWNKFMRESLKNTDPEIFPTPPPNTAQKPSLRGSNGGIVLKINRITGRIASSSTPEELIEERTYLPPHTILHYVNKDDPQGPPTANPADDPQYANWETGLADWVSRQRQGGNNIVLEEPLTEYDNGQSLEFAPALKLIWPQEGAVLTNRQMDIQVNAASPRGIAKVNFYIDGVLVGANDKFPFNFSYYAQKLAKGPHTLKVLAQDDLGNAARQEITFALQAEFDPPDVSWFDASPLVISAEDFPRIFNLVPFRWDDTSEIKIYLLSSLGSRLIYTFNHTEDSLLNNMLSFTWKNSPGAGDYNLKAVLTDKTGRVVERVFSVVVR